MRILLRRTGVRLAVAIGCTALATAAMGDTPMHEDISERIGKVAFYPCDLESRGQARRVECATLAVPEDYEQPDGRQIDLFITRLKADAATPKPDPLLAIAGGPGQAASETYLFLDRVFDDLAGNRTIYLVDQRGTGRSHKQACDLEDEAQLMLEADVDALRDAAEQCLDQFDGDPTRYTTSVAIEDLERVREALDVPHWNLMGVSYGTRVVQHYMRRYPESVRTALLDSVVPPEVNLGPDIPVRSQAALDAFFRRCATTDACRERYPRLEERFEALLGELRDTPRPVTFENMHSGRRETRTITDAHVMGLVRMSLYHTDQTALLPPILHEAYANGNYAPLARNAFELIGKTTDAMAMGMHNAVVCTEDVPFYREASLNNPAMADSYMGDLIVEALVATCSVWPRGTLDTGFKAPVTSDIPTLLFSGEVDPITPPAYAEQAMAGLSRARHFVAPGQGHSVSVLGCAPTLIARFVQAGSPADLDGACLDRLAATPPFIDFNGPAQ